MKNSKLNKNVQFIASIIVIRINNYLTTNLIITSHISHFFLFYLFLLLLQTKADNQQWRYLGKKINWYIYIGPVSSLHTFYFFLLIHN